jgi:hypothetical protein
VCKSEWLMYPLEFVDGCVQEDPAKQLLLKHVNQASYSCVYALCELSRENLRECRCCVIATAFVVPAGVGRPMSLPSCSKCIPSCVIINYTQDTGIRRRSVCRWNFLVYYLCYYDRSSILGSNIWYRSLG